MFSIVGHLTDDPKSAQLITRNGMETELKAQGWDGFNERGKRPHRRWRTLTFVI